MDAADAGAGTVEALVAEAYALLDALEDDLEADLQAGGGEGPRDWPHGHVRDRLRELRGALIARDRAIGDADVADTVRVAVAHIRTALALLEAGSAERGAARPDEPDRTAAA